MIASKLSPGISAAATYASTRLSRGLPKASTTLARMLHQHPRTCSVCSHSPNEVTHGLCDRKHNCNSNPSMLGNSDIVFLTWVHGSTH